MFNLNDVVRVKGHAKPAEVTKVTEAEITIAYSHERPEGLRTPGEEPLVTEGIYPPDQIELVPQPEA
jgi:hypothetical protein